MTLPMICIMNQDIYRHDDNIFLLLRNFLLLVPHFCVQRGIPHENCEGCERGVAYTCNQEFLEDMYLRPSVMNVTSCET
ncbi:hypothetical protein ACFXTI_005541 [Malus domestica]